MADEALTDEQRERARHNWKIATSHIHGSVTRRLEKAKSAPSILVDAISTMADPEVLEFSGFALREIDARVFELEHLRVLSLQENMLERLPPSIGLLTNLSKLKLRNNHLRLLPESICQLQQLQLLSLAFNRLVRLPLNMDNLVKLERLHLEGNLGLHRHPVELGLIEGLHDYAFDHATTEFPPPEVSGRGVQACKDLLCRLATAKRGEVSVLNLSWMRLKQVPLEVKDALKIKEILLENNNIAMLPPEIGKVVTIKKMAFDMTKIKFPPREVTKAGALTIMGFLSAFYNARKSHILHLKGFHLLVVPKLAMKLKAMKVCDLSGNQLTDLPQRIVRLFRLTSLLLDDNKLTQLPRYVSILSTLEILHVSNNHLDSLPNELFSRAIHLKDLQLNHNKMDSVPTSIVQCTQLKKMGLAYNHIARLPLGMSKLESLEHLDLGHNKLQRLHPELGGLTSLQTLTAGGNRGMKCPPPEVTLGFTSPNYTKDRTSGTDARRGGVCRTTPATGDTPWQVDLPPLQRYLRAVHQVRQNGELNAAGVGMMTVTSDIVDPDIAAHVTHLDLSYNRITVLPDELGILTCLHRLDISDNLLAKLSPIVGTLTLLESLRLENNFITALPKELGACGLMSELALDGNAITFPSTDVTRHGPQAVVTFLRDFSAASVTLQLTLNNRGLSDFPEEVATFHFIMRMDFSNNAFAKLPLAFTRMEFLEEAVFTNNRIRYIPSELSGLHSLKLWNLQQNDVHKLPNGIGDLTTLTELDLSHNQMATLPDSMGKLVRLSTLNVSSNGMSRLPDTLGGLTSLQCLLMSYNALLVLPQSMSCLTKLTEVSVSSNRLQILPAALGNMPLLEKLSHQHNPFVEPMDAIALQPTSVIVDLLGRFHKAGKSAKLVRGGKELRLQNYGLTLFPDLSQDVDMLVAQGWCVRSLRALFLGKNSLTTLPESIAVLSQLRILSLPDNKVTSLPQTLSALVQLTTLDARNNQLVQLPIGLGNATLLASLYVGDNVDLIAPPPEVIEQPANVAIRFLRPCFEIVRTGVDILNWQGLEITSLLPLRPLFDASGIVGSSIKILDVSRNKLPSLPPSALLFLERLEYIDASDNPLEDVTEVLGQMSHLQTLKLERTVFEFMPNAVCLATNISTLDLLGNRRIKSPPPEVAELGASACLAFLTALHSAADTGICDIRQMRLVALPHGLAKLDNLVKVDLDDNMVEVVCTLMTKLSHLETLSLRRNRVSLIDPSIGLCTSLTELFLEDNMLQRLPMELGLLTNITNLNCKGNPLRSPPPILFDLGTIPQFLNRCLAARAGGMSEDGVGGDLDVSRFQIPTFPLEALDCGQLTSLSVAHNAIEELPSFLEGLSALTSLRLDHNRIKTLPAGVSALGAVVLLRLDHNQLSALPPAMGNMSSLERLNCAHNHLDDLPNSVGDLEKLQVLSLRSNKLIALPSTVGQCTSLETLELSANPLERLPKELGRLSSLVNMDFDDELMTQPPIPVPSTGCAEVLRYLWNLDDGIERGFVKLERFSLIELPSEILKYKHEIRSISFKANVFTRVADSVGMLRALNGTLDFSDNKIRELPGSIADLNTVAIFNVSSNRLPRIPRQIASMIGLTELYLHNNRLEMLPRGLGMLTNLLQLTLNSNLLARLPQDLGALEEQLTYMNIDDNPFITPPAEVLSKGFKHVLGYLGRLNESAGSSTIDLSQLNITDCMPSLEGVAESKHLLMDYNHLETLPQEFFFLGQLSSLESLCIGHNLMHALSPHVREFRSLRKLSIESNAALSALPSSIGDLAKLSELRLSRCCVRALPESIRRLERLQVLDASYNQLQDLPEVLILLTALQTLDVGHNRLKATPPGMSSFTNLTKISLASNRLTKLPRGVGGLHVYFKLQHVEVSGNPIITVPPPEIQEQGTSAMLKYLGALWIAKTSMLCESVATGLLSIPHDMTSLMYLIQLRLPNNDITEIPDQIAQLVRLEKLDLSGNHISELPPKFFHLKTLKEARLSNNELTVIPSDIEHLHVLAQVYLEHNAIFEFPVELVALNDLEILVVTPFGLQEDQRAMLDHGPKMLMPYLLSFRLAAATRELELSHTQELPWQPLTVFPYQVFKSAPLITVLLLEDNALRALPDRIDELSCLQELRIDRNDLIALPPTLARIRTLELITVEGNHDMISPMYDWATGTGITVERILHYLNGILAAANSGDIDLSFLDLPDFPLVAPWMVEIRSLVLDANQLLCIPSVVLNMNELLTLTLNTNKLTEIDPNIVRCRRLRCLRVAGNMLTELPDELFQLTRLEELDVSDNRLVRMPSLLRRLSELRVLVANGNQLESSPQLHGLDNLVMLSLSGCGLSWFEYGPEPLPSLVVINLDNNNLNTISDVVGFTTSLKGLYLSGNVLRAVPPAVCQLTQLERLRLGGNNILGLPPTLARLWKLKYLEIDGNERLSFPPRPFVRDGVRSIMTFLYRYLFLEEQSIPEGHIDEDELELIMTRHAYEEEVRRHQKLPWVRTALPLPDELGRAKGKASTSTTSKTTRFDEVPVVSGARVSELKPSKPKAGPVRFNTEDTPP